MRVYRYLVSYLKESRHGTQQIGSAIIERSKDTDETEAELRENLKADKIGLLSFSLLEGEI